MVTVTRFRFETRGMLDDDRVRTYDRSAFLALLPGLLQQDAGQSADRVPMRRYIENLAQPPPNAVGPDGLSARVGCFQFEWTGDRWLFVRAYCGD